MGIGAPPEHERRFGWRFWPVVVVCAGYTGLAILMMVAASMRPNHAQRYVQILELFLSWPTLVFSILLIAVLLFHHELKATIDRIQKITYGDTTVDLWVQRRAPHDARAPDLPDDPRSELGNINRIEARTQVDPGTLADYALELLGQNDRLRSEARFWWHRYLISFLTVPSQAVLRQIRGRPGLNLAKMLEEIDDHGHIGSVPEALVEEVFGFNLASPYMPRQSLVKSLEVLEKYELIESMETTDGDKTFHLTQAGTNLLHFLDSPEGREFHNEVINARRNLVEQTTLRQVH